MYNAVFINDNGLKYNFGVAGSTAFDMDLGNGISVDLGTSQGFAQIGETVETKKVSGRPINVHGCIYENVTVNKNLMRKVLSPFSEGTLIFEGKYSTRVHVKDAPTFAPDNGKFAFQLFAPFPYFFSDEESRTNIGIMVVPQFRFPINYSKPHAFGKRVGRNKTNVFNDGDVKVPFELRITTEGISTNVVLSNLNTFEFLKINGRINKDDEIHIYRDNRGILRATLTNSLGTKDIISRVDEKSTLFEMYVGDNFLNVVDDEKSDKLNAILTFKPAVVSLYER